MKSIRLFSRQVGYITAAVALLLTFVVPAIASAAALTERSIALSSSSVSATDVTYQVNFTSVGAAGAFVVDFCSNTSVVGAACTAPGGSFSVSSASSTTSGFTSVAALSANTVRVTGTIGAAAPISVAIAGIDNPSSAGPLYARIVTYDTATHANAYASTVLGTGHIDDGGAAISITNTIGVSGAVLESMTFCVSGAAISADCAGVTSPVITLGETVGSTTALVPTAVSTGTINTQISTNAQSGAVVSLKSDALNCGGLKRAGSTSACDITPALLTGITAGQAKFGVKTATSTDTTGALGTYQPVSGSGYNASTYALNYVSGNATGVTSTYGDPFLDTASAPVNNKNMALTFGASISNSTPAGLYSANLSLIASGKF